MVGFIVMMVFVCAIGIGFIVGICWWIWCRDGGESGALGNGGGKEKPEID